MNIRPIKTEADHARALKEVTKLMEQSPPDGSDDADRLEVLATLISKYEEDRFQIDNPTPIEAIRFRMDQQGLGPKDLIPYIGSASKVSEILGGKRPLSMSMVRSLRDNLGIPVDVLISKEVDSSSGSNVEDADLHAYPWKQMCEYKYFGEGKSPADIQKNAKKALAGLFAKAKLDQSSAVYCRSTARYKHGKKMDQLALQAWQARVIIRSYDSDVSPYRPGTITKEFLEEIARLSISNTGPTTARDMLEAHGIPVVVERHLNHTYLDGACFLRSDNVPVVGMTIRYDRLDNFWFTLLHELVHVWKHLNPERRIIFDDLDAPNTEVHEKEADSFAEEALISDEMWQESGIVNASDWRDVRIFARKIGRNPAIVAGRIQRKTGNYKKFSTLVRRVSVRDLFGLS